MHRTTSFPISSATRPLAALLSGLLFAAISASAAAADEDVQVWVPLTFSHSPDEDLDLSLEITPRFNGAADGSDVILARVNADYRLSPHVAIGGGAGVFEYANGSEIRPHQQFTFKTGQLALRTRLEERFVDGADRMELRARERVQANFPLNEATSLTTSAEALVRLRSRRQGEKVRVDQLRFIASLGHRLTPWLSGSAGYMMILTPVASGPDRISHVPMIAFNARL